MPLEQLAFERGEEALTHRVVVRIAHAAHRWSHTHVPAPLPERDRRVLAALIGMVNHIDRSALRERHVERLEHELGPQVRRHRPTDDPAAPRIEDDGEVEKPAQVGTYVMSATQRRSGPAAVKSRSTRSGAGRASRSRMVVRVPLRRLTPVKLSARMSRATRLRPTRTPSAPSSAWIRRSPYVARD